MIDNAPYHRSLYIKDIFKEMRLPIFYLGPYQYKMAPTELFFAFVKNRDLNPLQVKAYKRGYLQTYMKEICLQISQLDFNWIPKAYIHVLQNSLECLSLKDL